MVRGTMNPADLDPLDAAATPITVDPATRFPSALRQKMIARLVAAGDDPEVAARTVDDEIARTAGTPGEMTEEYFNSINTPASNAALARRIAEGRADDARMAGFARDYNEATGNSPPRGARPSPAQSYAGNALPMDPVAAETGIDPESGEAVTPRSAALAAYERSQAQAERERMFRDAGMPMRRVPAPRNPDGMPVAQGAEFADVDEAADYVRRMPADGQIALDQAARELAFDPAAGGLPQVGRFVASQQDVDMRKRGYVPVYTPNGVAYQLESVANNEVEIPNVGMPGLRGYRPELREKYETVAVPGPTGMQYVLKPTKEFKAQQDANNKARRERLNASKQERLAHWRAMTMLAGGSQNIHAGNRAVLSQMAMLPEHEMLTQLGYALPGGQERAAVEARQLDAATRIAANAITGQLPGMANNNADAARFARAQQATQHFETWHARTFGMTRAYTRQDRDAVVNYMMRVYGIDQPTAEAIADSKPAQVAGGTTAPPDAGEMPPVST